EEEHAVVCGTRRTRDMATLMAGPVGRKWRSRDHLVRRTRVSAIPPAEVGAGAFCSPQAGSRGRRRGHGAEFVGRPFFGSTRPTPVEARTRCSGGVRGNRASPDGSVV